jgi:hypothetical protein
VFDYGFSSAGRTKRKRARIFVVNVSQREVSVGEIDGTLCFGATSLLPTKVVRNIFGYSHKIRLLVLQLLLLDSGVFIDNDMTEYRIVSLRITGRGATWRILT